MALHAIEAHVEGAQGVIVQLYQSAFSLYADRACYRLNGGPARWGLDMRKPLSDGRLLSAASRLVASKVRALGVQQIVGTGFGSFLLVGGILALEPDWKGGMIRDRRKQHGFREIVEGSLDRGRPVVLVDDIIASGQTICQAAVTLLEEGFQPVAVVPLFKFDWYRPSQKLDELGISVIPIATLNYSEKEEAERVKIIWECTGQQSVSWVNSEHKTAEA